MFFKNNFKPAFATADASYSSKSSKTLRSDSVMFADNAGTDDFNAFDSTPNYNNAGAQKRPQQRSQQRPQQRPQGSQAPRKKAPNKKYLSIIIAAAAILVLVVAIVVSVVIISSLNKDIEFENNSFIAFKDEDGNYTVVVNGKELGTYENEIELRVAADRSFAYVIETSLDGSRVHIANSKEIEAVTNAYVTEILATADLEPGVVYKNENGVYLYTDKKDERITRELNYNNWLISDDASTVVYTAPVEGGKEGEFNLYIYRDNADSKLTRLLTPAAISGDGTYLYGWGQTELNGPKKLYVIDTTKEGAQKKHIADNFVEITAMNADGNEIIYYTTGENATTTSHIFAFDKKPEDASPAKIANGIFNVKSTDSDVAIPESFAGCYLVSDLLDESATNPTRSPMYYIKKDFSTEKVSNNAGKFSPDGKYFYYIADNSGSLMQIDLNDDKYSSEKIPGAEDVVDFAITKKGNIYFLDDQKVLRYYSTSKDDVKRVSEEADLMTMYNYANTLYFYETNNVNVLSVKEGSSADSVKFDSSSVTGLPIFSDTDSKRTYAAFLDPDNGDWKLFYTSNGKKFVMVSDSCTEILGFSNLDLNLGLGGNIGSENTNNNSSNIEETTNTR